MPRSGTSFSFSEGEWKGRNRFFRTDRIVVKAKVAQGTSDNDIGNVVKDILHDIGGTLVRRRPNDTLFVAKVEGGDIPAIAESLMDPAARSDVDFAEPDLRVRSSAVNPSDYYYNNASPSGAGVSVRQQWGPQKINAPVAWEFDKDGSDEVLIAVIDSGLSMSGGAFDHPELSAARFEDGKSYIDVDVVGDAAAADAEAAGLDAAAVEAARAAAAAAAATVADEHYHGTHMTGIIAAPADNVLEAEDVVDGTTSKDFGTDYAEGIAGLNWNSPVLIHRVLDRGNSLVTTEGAEGGIADVYDAVMEVKDRVTGGGTITRAVVNLSLGVEVDDGADVTAEGDPKTLMAMCEQIVGLPIILCCATGNDTATARVDFPAAYAHGGAYPENVLSVGATESDDTMWPRSNYVNNEEYVSLVAPGGDITSTLYTYAPTTADDGFVGGTSETMYGHYSGTSQATAHVTGVVSLIWSRNPKLTSGQVIEILKNTAVPLDSGDLPNDRWGCGRIDAGAAVTCAEMEVMGEETSIAFEGVELEITEDYTVYLLIRSCATIDFQVTTTGYDFGINPGTLTYSPSSSTLPEEFVRFAIGVASYTGNTNDAIAFGTVSILQEGEADPIVVYITASTVGASNALISLVLDGSGSMGGPSGVGTLTRMDVLHRAAGIMVEALRENDAMGLIRFSADADELLAVKTVSAVEDDPGKVALIDAIESMGDDGLTSIGDGLVAANTQIEAELAANPNYTHTAIVVLTDGKETAVEYIEDVSVSHPVYAVAMGVETEVDTLKLERLAGGSEGYLLMSGELDHWGIYRIAKYFLQILVNVSNDVIIKDPQARILPGQEHVVPFSVTSADTRADVLLLMSGMPDDDRDELKGILDLRVVTPSGRVITPGDSDGDRIVYRHGANVSYFRLKLPHTVDDRSEHQGPWRALVTLDAQRFKDYLAWWDARGGDIEGLQVHGVPFMLLMHARSSVRLDAHLSQSDFRPGAEVTLRARVLENGRALRRHAVVKAQIAMPDGSSAMSTIREVGPGTFGETHVARVPGTYTWRITAEGRTRDGEWFTREHVATASVWV